MKSLDEELNEVKERPVMYEIWQLKENEANHYYQFTNSRILAAEGRKIEPERYEKVYTGVLDKMTLEDIFVRFNTNLPKDYRGHSLSVSDVIVIDDGNDTTAHFVDSFGFIEVKGFPPATDITIISEDGMVSLDYEAQGKQKDVYMQVGYYSNGNLYMELHSMTDSDVTSITSDVKEQAAAYHAYVQADKNEYHEFIFKNELGTTDDLLICGDKEFFRYSMNREALHRICPEGCNGYEVKVHELQHKSIRKGEVVL